MASASLPVATELTGLAATIAAVLPDQFDGFAPVLANIASALLILIVGFWAAGMVSGFVRNTAMRNPKIDDTLGTFFASIAKYLILAFVVIAVLGAFGVEATSLVAVLGAATLAIGLALQGTLNHVASGVMLIMFRPYKLGDFVDVAGHSGTVKEITIFTTVLSTVDNVKVIIPNGEAWAGSLKNFSGFSDRRLDITFGISYDDDIAKASQIILDIAGKVGTFKAEPAEPWVRVVELNESSVDLQFRGWLEGGDYWESKFAMLRQVKEAFDAAGVEIPYPHAVEIEKPLPPKAA